LALPSVSFERGTFKMEELIKRNWWEKGSFWKNNTWFYVTEGYQPFCATTLPWNGMGLNP
jgi:hypothetical protein